MRAGLVPVLTDVDPATWQVTTRIAASLQSEAVVPVATYGMAVDIREWEEFAHRTGRRVVLDAASALGAQAVGQQVPAVFSLHATKPLGSGEGGVLCAADAAYVERVRELTNFGFRSGRVVTAGTNAKMSEYAAAIALAQLQRRADIGRHRWRVWSAYRRHLGSLPGVTLQAGGLGGPPSVLVVDLGRPAEPVVSALAGCGIETRRWYCPPLHEHPAFAPFATGQAPEVSSRLGTSLLGLPFHHFLSSEDIGAVVAALAEALQSRPVPRPSADVGEAANTGWLPSASA